MQSSVFATQTGILMVGGTHNKPPGESCRGTGDLHSDAMFFDPVRQTWALVPGMPTGTGMVCGLFDAATAGERVASLDEKGGDLGAGGDANETGTLHRIYCQNANELEHVTIRLS